MARSTWGYPTKVLLLVSFLSGTPGYSTAARPSNSAFGADAMELLPDNVDISKRILALPSGRTDFVVRTASSLEKVFQNSFKKGWARPGLNDEVILSAARNESESFQIVVIPVKELHHLRWEVTGHLDPSRVKVQPVGYVNVTRNSERVVTDYPEEKLIAGLWPDPLYSTWHEIEKVEANKIQPMWVTVDVPKDIRPGQYQTRL